LGNRAGKEEDVLGYIRARQGEMLEFLGRMVNMDSGTYYS